MSLRSLRRAPQEVQDRVGAEYARQSFAGAGLFEQDRMSLFGGWMGMDDSITSPTGRFEITLSPWEARMSLWVETPTLKDTSTGATLLSFDDVNWSLNSATWHSDAIVELCLRKYPGSHAPSEVRVTLDCVEQTAQLADEVVQLPQAESLLERAIRWPQAAITPIPTGPAGLLTRLHRFWRGLS